MKTIKKSFWIIISIAVFAAASGNQAQAESAMVGRISHIEGQLLRYVPENKDWVATVRDAPFGFNDALYSTKQSRAEIIMPNNTWIRIGSDTQLQLLSAANNLTEVDVGFGMARLYNKSSVATLRATTPFGYITAPPTACFDVYVGDSSAEVIALNGTVDFVHVSGGSYEVKTGLSSVIADKQQVTSGSGRADSDWNSWNVSQNHIWDNRLQARGESVKYLPEPLHTEAYVLEENGRWESVYYENEYRYFWRPRVSVGWAPFTVGRWTSWYGDHCWIPAEPFGYVTHHYGNWLYVNNFWYWAPPVIGVSLGPIGIGFGWYPGRVSWIHSGVYVGWVPLAPHEVYYGHRYWGPNSAIISPKVHVNMGRYRYIDRAVIIHRDNLYHVSDYSRVEIAHINHQTIIKNYRPAPVINHTVIRNYDSIPQKHHFTNAVVTEKPRYNTVDRIQQNQHYRSPERTPAQPSRHGETGQSGQTDNTRIHRPVTPTTQSGTSEQNRIRMPMTPTTPTQPSRHGESGQSGQPDSTRIHRPVTPTTPSGTSEQNRIRMPMQPTPSQPLQPDRSSQRENVRTHTPSAPVTPSAPSELNRHTQPVQPMQPTQPSRHEQPVRDTRSNVQPIQPVQPQRENVRTHTPSAPVTPSAPSELNRRTQPVQPLQPTQPKQHQQPTKRPEKSGQPDELQRKGQPGTSGRLEIRRDRERYVASEARPQRTQTIQRQHSEIARNSSVRQPLVQTRPASQTQRTPKPNYHEDQYKHSR
jgi:hypothetical protein